MPDFAPCFHVESSFFNRNTQVHIAYQHEEKTTRLLDGVVIAVASDAAFCFIYAANLAWLRDEGATTCFFSPLSGEPIPQKANALWLPGGYPELHAQQLSQSASWESIRRWIADGKPTLAECGGMMVLGEAIITKQGETHAMAGVLPFHCAMQDRLAGLGYREDASGARGHEFHHSKRIASTTMPSAFSPHKGDAGLRHHNVRASYIHWYFASQPQEVATWFH